MSGLREGPIGNVWFSTAGGASVGVQDELRDALSAKHFGASPRASAAANDAAFADAITYCAANFKSLFVPGYGYNLSANLNLNGVRVFGDANTQFSAAPTFISSVVGPTYAITLNSGCLENISVKVNSGNGIDASMCLRKTGLLNVTVETATPVRAGSIGVSYGSDATPGTQAISCTFQKVTTRNFDIGEWARFYSNTNVYLDHYILNTTTGAGNQSTVGIKINGRGGTWINPRVESNYVDAIRLESDSTFNTVIQPWTEGTNTNTIVVDGIANFVSNPISSANVSVMNANSRVFGRTGTSVPYDGFYGQGSNFIPNSAFESALSGWTNVGAAAISTANKIWGYNSLEVSSSAASTLQSSVNITDAKVLEKIAGKPVTVLAVGQKLNSAYSASVRLLVNTGAGYSQVATGDEFSSTAPSISRVSYLLPSTITGLQFRVFGQGANPASTLIARFALPSMFVGSDIEDILQAPVYDGANTFNGNQTLNGGSWNTAHMILGTYHLWVEAATGKLRIKNGAPVSDADGTVVGTQA